MGLLPHAPRLSAVLSRANATSALVALHARGPLGAIDLARAMGGNKDLGRLMGSHLESFGLARVEEVPGPIAGRVAYRISLTSLGAAVAADLQSIAGYFEEGKVRAERPRLRGYEDLLPDPPPEERLRYNSIKDRGLPNWDRELPRPPEGDEGEEVGEGDDDASKVRRGRARRQ